MKHLILIALAIITATSCATSHEGVAFTSRHNTASVCKDPEGKCGGSKPQTFDTVEEWRADAHNTIRQMERRKVQIDADPNVIHCRLLLAGAQNLPPKDIDCPTVISNALLARAAADERITEVSEKLDAQDQREANNAAQWKAVAESLRSKPRTTTTCKPGLGDTVTCETD